jgi:hypothetical protein
MRFALQKAVSTIAAATLVCTGTAQALLYRCGSDLRASCCREKDRPADQARLATPDPHACCSIAATPAGHDDAAPQPVVSQPSPVLIAAAFAVAATFEAPAALAHDPVDLGRSVGPPILLATCAFLI